MFRLAQQILFFDESFISISLYKKKFYLLIISTPLRRKDQGEVENAPCAWGLPFLFAT